MAASDDIKFTLPYLSDDLPAPLPTQEQIENPDQVLVEVGGRKVVRVGKHYVVKWGSGADEIEAATMIYLRGKTSINLPRVYAVDRFDDNGALVIVMEFIPGKNLFEAWPELSSVQKNQICLDLNRQICQLRSLPPLGYCGGVGRTPVPDGIFWTGKKYGENPHINGPFQDEDELNSALVGKTLLVDETWNGTGPQRARFYERMLPSVFRGHPPIFTHGDLQRKNIIIRPYSTNEGSSTGEKDIRGVYTVQFRVFLVDWGKAGWYPTYWAYCVASSCFRFNDDWPEYVEKIVDSWPIEHAWFHILRNELWS